MLHQALQKLPIKSSRAVTHECLRVLLYDCRAAYVGVNTWDLMDKSRDTSARPEILQRLDAMVKAGWSVGRTWGFSLGGGLSDGPLGKVIADPTKILETAPGESAAFCACRLRYSYSNF